MICAMDDEKGLIIYNTPDENSVIVLMGKTAMDKESYQRVIPRIREDATLFPVGSASKGD